MPANHPKKLVTAPEMAAALSVSTDTLKRWVRTGKVPAPIKMSARCSRFDLGAVMLAIKGAENE